jgi:non-ribosomal peptide synthetase component F
MHVKSVPFILVFLDASIRVPVGFLGVLKAGYAVLPLDTETPLDRIRFILNDARVSVVVTQAKHVELFQTGIMNGTLGADLQVLDIDQGLLDVTYADAELPVLARDGLEPAYCIYTSGTTGHPVSLI